MSVNGISAIATTYDSAKTKHQKNDFTKSNNTSKGNGQNTQSAVYETSSNNIEKKKEYKPDTATLTQLKADAQRRTQQLRDIVEKMLVNQGQTFDEANMYQLLREGKIPVDAETSAQAKSDIAEDGYWGVTQTSDRLVSFAIALTGGDSDKADEMIAAVKEGFEQATKSWGDELPDISRQTLDATLKKLDEWKNSKNT